MTASTVQWSADVDLEAREPVVLSCFPRSRAVLAEGADGATGATGLAFTSAAIGSGWLTAGVDQDMFLEITAGAYQAFYPIASVVAGTVTLARSPGASLTGLAFRVRTFNAEHQEAFQHYLDRILRRLGSTKAGDSADSKFDRDKVHPRSQRDLRDLCVARVLAQVLRAASDGRAEVGYQRKAEYWAAQESRLVTCLDELEMDTDADDAVDTVHKTGWGSVEAGIS